jgi:zinc protease
MTSRVDCGNTSVVYLEESHKLPLVSIVLALRTGNAHEPIGKDGIARITARMLRRGAQGLDARTIEDAIDRLGGEMAVDTGASSVAIHAQVIRRNADAFMDLLGRLLGTPTFPEDEFERLKRETLAEIDETKDHDRSLAQQAFRRAMFGAHPYGRDGAGTVTTVTSLTGADAKAHYARHFTKGNTVIGFAGDVTAADAGRFARMLTERLPDGAAVVDDVGPPPAIRDRRLIFVDKPERTQTQIVIGTQGTWPHDPDHVALSVATSIFGGTFTSRLMREVRSKRGWSYGASARASIDRQRQSFSMWTFPAADDAAPCLSLELELLETFVKDGIAQDELEFIKGYLTRSHAFEIDTAPKRLHQAIDVELLRLPSDYYSGYLEHVKAVTVAGANAAVRKRLHTGNLLVVVVGTAGDIFDAVKAAVPSLSTHAIVPFDAEVLEAVI